MREVEETLQAIRSGAADAIALGSDTDRQMYKIDSADRPHRELVEEMQEGALIMSAEAVVLYANQCLGEVLRQTAAQMVGKHLIERIAPSQQEMIRQLIDESLNGPARGEFRLVSAGEETPVLFSFRRVESDGIQERVICAVLTDLIKQRQIEARLNQAQKMKAVSQLTGGLAHIFNNLLQAIRCNLELIRQMSSDSQRVARWAENGLCAFDRGAKLTAKLLAFARSQQLRLSSVAMTDLVKGMANLFCSNPWRSFRGLDGVG